MFQIRLSADAPGEPERTTRRWFGLGSPIVPVVQSGFAPILLRGGPFLETSLQLQRKDL